MAAPVLSELIAEVEFLLRALEIVQAEGEPPRAWAERVEGLDRAVRTLQRDQLLLEAAQLGAELLQWTRDHVLPAECSEPEPVDSWESLVEALLGMEAILGDLSSREPELPIVEPLLQQLESMVLSPSDLPESPICCSLSPALWEGMESSDQHNLMRTLDEVSATVSEELGFPLPPTLLVQEPALAEWQYSFTLMGVPIAQGSIPEARTLALYQGAEGGESHRQLGEAGRDPVFGVDGIWLDPQHLEAAGAGNFLLIPPSSVLSTHLHQVLPEHGRLLFSDQAAEAWLEDLDPQRAELLAEGDRRSTLLQLARILLELEGRLIEKTALVECFLEQPEASPLQILGRLIAAREGEADPERVESYRSELTLELGEALVGLALEDRLVEAVRELRENIDQQLGFRVPPVHIRSSMHIQEDSYRVLVRGAPAASGTLKEGALMALCSDEGADLRDLQGEPFREPAYGMSALWIPPEAADSARSAGCLLCDHVGAVVTHLGAVVQRFASALLTEEVLHDWMQQLSLRSRGALLDPELQQAFQRHLRALLEEGVPLRQADPIAEDFLSAREASPEDRLNRIRVLLREDILRQLAPEGQLLGQRLAPPTEALLLDQLSQGSWTMERDLQLSLVQQLLEPWSEGQGPVVVLVEETQLRLPLRELLTRYIPEPQVLTTTELGEEAAWRPIAPPLVWEGAQSPR